MVSKEALQRISSDDRSLLQCDGEKLLERVLQVFASSGLQRQRHFNRLHLQEIKSRLFEQVRFNRNLWSDRMLITAHRWKGLKVHCLDNVSRSIAWIVESFFGKTCSSPKSQRRRLVQICYSQCTRGMDVCRQEFIAGKEIPGYCWLLLISTVL